LKLAVAEIGNITERQINKMVDPSTNDCLPAFLTNKPGLNSGLMIIQYAAAGIVSENKVLVHPASADSIPTSANTEDHVSMGTIAARQALEITENVEKVITYSILTGFYALSLRLEQFRQVKMEYSPEKRLAKATYEFYRILQETNKEFDIDNKFLSKDRFYKPEIKVLHANFDAFAEIADKYLS
jgi:histidine ammonia-lyase